MQNHLPKGGPPNRIPWLPFKHLLNLLGPFAPSLTPIELSMSPRLTLYLWVVCFPLFIHMLTSSFPSSGMHHSRSCSGSRPCPFVVALVLSLSPLSFLVTLLSSSRLLSSSCLPLAMVFSLNFSCLVGHAATFSRHFWVCSHAAMNAMITLFLIDFFLVLLFVFARASESGTLIFQHVYLHATFSAKITGSANSRTPRQLR